MSEINDTMDRTDWRALCEELVEALEIQLDELRFDNRLCKRARAALAQPEPEVMPSDEEIMGLMPQQMHEDLATAARAMAEQAGADSTRVKGAMRIILNRHVVDLAHAAIAADRARWGRPAPAPAGEVCKEEIDCETCEGSGTIDETLGGYGDSNPAATCPDCDGIGVIAVPAPAPTGEVGELVRWLRGANWDSKRQTLATRAADLVERHAALVPVAVSERPWEREGWCDSEGRCWIHCPGQSWDTWVLMVPQNAIDGAHCLPATALPLPGNTESGGCND